MEKFFIGEEESKTRRMARLLSKLCHTIIYLDEDFGSDSGEDPWGFFVTTDTSKNFYAKYINGVLSR